MRVWLITVGEPLPLDGVRDRLWRTGLLAEILATRGHEVLWWTSTVDHFRKRLFVAGEPRMPTSIGVSIQFLAGRLYRRNFSVSRLLNHVDIGRRFAQLARREPRPDIILCSFPTIELSREAVLFGKKYHLPVILDIRDLWPDIFLDVLPHWLQGGGKWLMHQLFDHTAWALRSCDVLFAVSQGYLEWGLDRAERKRTLTDAVYPLAYRLSKWTQSDESALQARLQASGIVHDDPVVLFVGTFGRTYDLGTVIESVRLIRQRGLHHVRFIFCGTGERDREWRQAAYGVDGIAFPGWLPAGELACLLDRSTIGLAAYATGAPQGVPNKVIEYLAAGLPVLCSLLGESRQLLESAGCGQYYPAGEPGALADGIERLIGDGQRRTAMADAARRTFNAHFAATTVYSQMADRLEQIGLG